VEFDCEACGAGFVFRHRSHSMRISPIASATVVMWRTSARR
jgi:hypothetical protein